MTGPAHVLRRLLAHTESAVLLDNSGNAPETGRILAAFKFCHRVSRVLHSIKMSGTPFGVSGEEDDSP